MKEDRLKLLRALLLSSQKQAEAWELKQVIGGLFPRHERVYRFLVDDQRQSNEGFDFQIFCVSHVPDAAGVGIQEVVAEHPHVDESFSDIGALHTFLHRFQIDLEYWSPVEPKK